MSMLLDPDSEPRKILLDTDPGGDDLFALLWLLSLVKQGVAELVAIATAEGNVAASQTFASASQLLGLTGFSHIPLGRGVMVDRPTQDDAAHIHGGDGMGNLSGTLPPPTHAFATAPPSDELLIETLLAAPGEVTIVAIAPFTNLAAAEKKHPGILQTAREVVLMAGAIHAPGNVTPQAEFNVWFNPEAAQSVLNSRTDLVIIPLDVTRHLILTEALAQTIVPPQPLGQLQPPSELAQWMLRLCQFMTGTALAYRETGGKPGFLVHDAATLAYLFYPETLGFRRAYVQVETTGRWTYGQTLVDDRHTAKSKANAWVATSVDAIGLFTCLVEDLKGFLQATGRDRPSNLPPSST